MNFEQWKKANPSSNLNDYYTWATNNGIISNDNKIQVEIPKIENNDNKGTDYSIVIGCIACTIGLIGFFTPWFSIPIFNIKISGNEINQLANFMDRYYEKKELLSKVSYIKYIYAIPINLSLLFITYIFKNNFLASILSLTSIILTGLLFTYILNNVSEALNLISYGLYLIAFASILNLCNLFTLKY